MTSTVRRERWVAMRPLAIPSPVGNEAQAQPTSKVPAFLAPSLCCTTVEVAGVR